MPTINDEINRFLHAGEYDPHCAAWSDEGLLEGMRREDGDLRAALIAEVQRRQDGMDCLSAGTKIDLQGFTGAKIKPMVRGLFPRSEREAAMRCLERSVVLVRPDNIHHILDGALGSVSRGVLSSESDSLS